MKISQLLFLWLFLLFIVRVNGQKLTTVYPKNHQQLSDSLVMFQWDEYIDTLLYQFQISTDSLFQNIVLDSSQISNTSLLVQLDYKEYYTRVKPLSSSPSLSHPFSSIIHFTIFSPKSLDSLALWLAADSGLIKDATGRVSQWNDLSGNSNNALQSSISLQPYFHDSVFLVNSAVYFNNDRMLGHYIDSVEFIDHTLFILESNEGSVNRQTSFGYYKNSITSYKVFDFEIWNYNKVYYFWFGDLTSYSTKSFGIALSNRFELAELIVNQQMGISVYNNSNLLGTSTITKQPGKVKNYILGSRYPSGNYLKGYIPEIIVYNQVLNDSSRIFVENYIKDKYTPPVNLGQNILRKYGFCDTILATTDMYESYLWNTGDTIRSISISKVDTGWYWCEVPNLYGDIMRDSVFVYDLVGKPNLKDTTICLNTSSYIELPESLHPLAPSISSSQARYTYIWRNSLGNIVSTDSVLQTTLQDTYSLKITDSLGCFIADTVNVWADSFQVQASLGIDKSLCTGDKIGLVSGQAQADSFLWSTGSGDSLIIINTAGNYSLIVSDTLGCTAKDTIVVDIHGVTPYVSFFADTVCFRDSTIFIDSSQSLDASNLIAWNWQFGDDSLALELSSSPILHLYPDSGTYTVRLTVSTDSSCTNYTYKNIYVRPLPEPNFYPLTACQNHELQFQNLTTNRDTIVSWHWDFGDTTYSNLMAPIKAFHHYSIYPVLLRATNIHGCTDSINRNVNILPSPSADFNNSTTCEGESISFSDNSTTLPYNPIQSWQWIFDSTSTPALSAVEGSSSPSHLFDSAGYYPVYLKTTAINHCWDTITKTVQLHANPEANFSSDTACYGRTVNFSNISYIQDDSINYYYWLSDGIAFSADKNATNVFNDTLEHQVVLKVRTTALCEDSIMRIIKSHPLPNAAFSTDREYGLPPLTINFTNLSTSTSTSTLTYKWNFGDGSQSGVEAPTHIYQDSTIYLPILTATNTFGCWDTVSHPIYAIYAAIDIAITDVVAEVNNGFISYSCEITNYGKQKIKELELFAKYNSGIEITETWTGELLTGQTIQYDFKSKAQVNSNQQIRYYCVRAELPLTATQEDENLSNNTLCKDLSNEFWLSPIYPNPVSDKIQFDLVLPYSENIKIQISDINGIIIQNYEFKAVKGLNQKSINISTLQSGQYFLLLESKEGSEVRKFIRL